MSNNTSDDEGSDDELEWMLGFCQDEDPATLQRHRFPSKVGGSPAWLDPVDVPGTAQLTCSITGKPLDFLLQVYAPVEDVDHAFHRAIFVFTTPAVQQVHRRGAVRAFRCQLPRDNAFYPSDPAPDGAPPSALPDDLAALAASRDRWGVVARERGAQGGDAATLLRAFPERELVVEPESEAAAKAGRDAEVQRVLEEYERRQGQDGEHVDAGELEAVAGSLTGAGNDRERATFASFQARVDGAPGQVLRYCFQDGAEPLWPSRRNLPDPADILPCPLCGSARRFEFQVLPHLVHYLGQDAEASESLDFGTIAVYTCSASCDPRRGLPEEEGLSGAYAEEFVWVLPPL